MNDAQDIIRAFRPLVRSWPLLILGILLGLVYAWSKLGEAEPSYQSRSSLRISDQHTSESEYLKELDPFLFVPDFLDVLALVRSDYLIGKAVKRLGREVWVYEGEEVKKSKLFYPKQPFMLGWQEIDAGWVDQPFGMEIHPDSMWRVGEAPRGQEWEGKWTDTVRLGGQTFWLNGVPEQFGRFTVRFPSVPTLIEELGNHDDMLVRLQNEKAPIINIYTWHSNPYLAADFANAMAAAYLDEFAQTKQQQAKMALQASMGQMNRLEKILDSLESRIASVAVKAEVLDLQAAFEYRFKQKMELEQLELNLELEMGSLEDVWSYLQNDKLENGIMPAFEALRDARLRQDLQKLLRKTRELQDLGRLVRPIHPAWQAREASLNRLRRQILRNVRDTRRAREGDREIIGAAAAHTQLELLELPEVRHTLNTLRQRYEEWMLRLLELESSRTEAYIAAMSGYLYQRQFEFAFPAADRLKPQPHVYYSVYSIMGLFWICVLLTLWELVVRPLRSVLDLSEFTSLPAWGTFSFSSATTAPGQDVWARALEWIVADHGQVWALASYKDFPDRIALSVRLASALGELGYPTLVVETDPLRPALAEWMGDLTMPGMRDTMYDGDEAPEYAWHIEGKVALVPVGEGAGEVLLPKAYLGTCLAHWSQAFAFILILPPAFAELPELATSHCGAADATSFLLRLHRTPLPHIKRLDRWVQRYPLPAAGWLVVQSA